MIKAEVLCKSVTSTSEVTTFMVTLPRFILAEINTHRAFSRNTASSRAIPFTTMLKNVIDNPFIPYYWQQKHKGMQGRKYFPTVKAKALSNKWLKSRDNAITIAQQLHNEGLTKQLCNRLLEPYSYTTIIITSCQEGLQNFFNLRCPCYHITGEKYMSYNQSKSKLTKRYIFQRWNSSQAEIHMQLIAEAMYDAYITATPNNNEWHIPYHDNTLSLHDNIISSVATCARISYMRTQHKDIDKDKQLYQQLLKDKHMSPFEHVAIAQKGQHYNLKDFASLRYLIEKDILKKYINI